MLDYGFCRQLGLCFVAGRNDGHVWQRSHDSQVLRSVMSGGQGAVLKTAAHSYYFHVKIVVANIISYLFQATQR